MWGPRGSFGLGVVGWQTRLVQSRDNKPYHQGTESFLTSWKRAYMLANGKSTTLFLELHSPCTLPHPHTFCIALSPMLCEDLAHPRVL